MSYQFNCNRVNKIVHTVFGVNDFPANNHIRSPTMCACLGLKSEPAEISWTSDVLRAERHPWYYELNV